MSDNRTDADGRIAQRLRRARWALGVTLDDLKAVMKRVDRHRARISRLEAAAAVPAAERRARAAKGLETRRQVPVHRRRSIRISEEGT
jgi:hypothetical protein